MFGPQWVWADFWAMTAFLSFILAVMNLLPIPALDGGHVMFLIVEMITRRPVPQKFLEYAQMFGVILLLGLMLYANGLDLLRGLGLWK
jgi:regulator of sigma E protease